MKFPKILLTTGILYLQQLFRVTTHLLLNAVQQNLISVDLFVVHARVISVLLWPPYVIGQAIVFLPCGFYLSSSFFVFFLA